MLYRDNVLIDKIGKRAPGSRSLTPVHTNVHCCHWQSKEVKKKVMQLIRGVNPLKGLSEIKKKVKTVYIEYNYSYCSE